MCLQSSVFMLTNCLHCDPEVKLSSKHSLKSETPVMASLNTEALSPHCLNVYVNARHSCALSLQSCKCQLFLRSRHTQ